MNDDSQHHCCSDVLALNKASSLIELRLTAGHVWPTAVGLSMCDSHLSGGACHCGATCGFGSLQLR